VENNPFFLAPMAGVTDSPFRSLMREMGCGVITTELVSAKSLQLGNEKSQKLMSWTEDQRPVGVQIFGEDLEALSVAAQIVEQSGADFIDLNFGCPVSKVVKKGAGSAVLKDLLFLRKMLQAVKKNVSIPVSIKVRTGWDIHSRNTHEVAKIAHEEGIIWMAVHGRTRAQAYSGNADWSYIQEVKSLSSLPIIGNGDLTQVSQVLRLKKESGCDGMMIGRGSLKNPWIFKKLYKQYHKEKSASVDGVDNKYEKGSKDMMPTASKKDMASVTYTDVLEHKDTPVITGSECITPVTYTDVLERLQYHLENFYDEKMFLLQYKKFSTWYSSGYPNSASFRRSVFQMRNKEEVLQFVGEYFYEIDSQKQEEVGYDPSLMQGHG